MESTKQRRVWCAGRFGFMLPEELTLAGRSQSIYRVGVDTQTLVEGKTAQEFWKEKLRELEARTEGSGAPKERNVRAMIPGASAAWYGANPMFPNDRTLLVMKPQRGHVVLLQVEAEAGNEAIAEQLVAETVAAYIPEARYGFCVGEGAITSEVSINEQALANFVSARHPGLEVSISTQTVSQPRSDHPLSDVEGDRQSFATRGDRLEVLRDGERTVAGKNGREGRVSLTSAREGTMLRYTWFHPGGQARGDEPEILLKASAFDKHKAELEATWELLLTSMKQLPRTR
ncbi:hypothetical protein F0U59_19615 [Archangium gephyra]|nr:hypothetical protein F0U59_19615 [Archangium gephyra]